MGQHKTMCQHSDSILYVDPLFWVPQKFLAKVSDVEKKISDFEMVSPQVEGPRDLCHH